MGNCTCPDMSFPLITAPSHGGSGPTLIDASFGPPESITQMASRSVQPLLHRLRQSVAILYNGLPSPPENYPFSWVILAPFNTIPWAHPSSQHKRHLDWFSRVCTDDHRMSLLYNGMPLPLFKIVPSHGETWTPI